MSDVSFTLYGSGEQKFGLCREDGDWSWRLTGDCTVGRPKRSIVGTARGRVVAAMVYLIEGGTLKWIASWVSPGRRGSGLALAMLDLAMEDAGHPERVWVSAVSDNGLTLIRAAERRYPGVEFDVVECGERALREKRRAA